MKEQPCISPAEVINALLAARLIGKSKGNEPCGSAPILVLCYLSAACQSNSPINTYSELTASFESIVHDCTLLEGLRNDILHMTSLDELSNAIDGVRSVINADKNASVNGLVAPNYTSPDSTLGIYLRSILARWECLHFHEACSHFDCLKLFIADSGVVNTAGSSLSPHTHDPCSVFRFVLGDPWKIPNADRDVNSEESLLHHHYDRCGLPPTSMLTSAGTADEAGAVIKALQALSTTKIDAQQSALKHQHAMLQIGRAWLQAGNAALAMSAIEEALKTAHQLSDHEAVAHALLLLYEVFCQSDDRALLASAEEILTRCAVRCAALNMAILTARCTLLLGALRSRQALQWNAPALQQRLDGMDDPSGQWRVDQVWDHVHFALLGEIALSAQVITPAGIVEDTEFTQSGPATNPFQQRQQQQQQGAAGKKENLQEVPLHLSWEVADLTVESSIVSASVWTRLKMLPQAQLELRRALHLLVQMKRQSRWLIAVCTDLLFAQVDAVRILSNTSGQRHQLLRDCFAFGKLAQAALDSGAAVADVAQQERFEAALVYALYEVAKQAGDSGKALRLAERMCALTQPIASAQDSGPAVTMTDEHFRARLIRCEATGAIDLPTARRMLVALRQACEDDGVRRDLVDNCSKMINS